MEILQGKEWRCSTGKDGELAMKSMEMCQGKTWRFAKERYGV